jgi:hypothetical protein
VADDVSNSSLFSLGLDKRWNEYEVAAFEKATAFLDATIAAYSSRIELATDDERRQLVAARAAAIRQKRLLSVGDRTTQQIAVMADAATVEDIRDGRSGWA